MNRYFRESVMDGTTQEGRQQGSVKQTQDGMQMISAPSINTRGNIGENEPRPLLPFEIDAIIPQITEIFVKITEIRNKFQSAKKNPTLTPSQKIGLNKAVDKLDEINTEILSVPNTLSPFVVEKRQK